MPETELFLIFVQRFNQAGFRYVIGGSVATIFYGEPRLTNDVDLVAFLNDADIRRLPEVFPPAEFYVPPPETIISEVAREKGGHFNIIHMNTGFKAWRAGAARSINLRKCDCADSEIWIIARILAAPRDTPCRPAGARRQPPVRSRRCPT